MSTSTLFAQDSTDTIIHVIPLKKKAALNLIDTPVGFEKSPDFNGYIHYQASSAIIMTFIENANYIKISEGMDEAFYAENQLKFIEDTSFVSDNSVPGNAYKLNFKTNDVDYIRYMVYAGDLNNTLWLNITYPVKYEALMQPVIMNVIKSIRLEE